MSISAASSWAGRCAPSLATHAEKHLRGGHRKNGGVGGKGPGGRPIAGGQDGGALQLEGRRAAGPTEDRVTAVSLDVELNHVRDCDGYCVIGRSVTAVVRTEHQDELARI